MVQPSFLSGTEYADVLEAITELDVTFFLCTNKNASNGKGVDAATNGKLFTFLKQTAKYTEFMVVPGGQDDTDLFGDANHFSVNCEVFQFRTGCLRTRCSAGYEKRPKRNEGFADHLFGCGYRRT